jgi:hypothetical protein
MTDEKSIVETITEDLTEAARAVLAEIKSVATEVTEAVESTATLCEDDTTKDGSAASSGSVEGNKPPR